MQKEAASIAMIAVGAFIVKTCLKVPFGAH